MIILKWKYSVVYCIHNVVLLPRLSSSQTFITSASDHLPLSSFTPCPPPTAPGNHQSVLSVWIYLFWIVHINGIIQHMTFCVWLLYPCCSMYQHFTPFVWIIFRCTDRLRFVYPFLHWLVFGLAFVHSADMNMRVQVLSEDLFTVLRGIYLAVEL